MAFHTPHGSTRFRLPWSWSSFDYRDALPGALRPDRRALRDRQGPRPHRGHGPHRPRRPHRPADRRRARLAPRPRPGANVQPPEAPISRGLEVHPHGDRTDLDVWIDRSLVRYGYAWSVPADGEQRIGVGSYEPRDHVKEPTQVIAQRLQPRRRPLPGQLVPARAPPRHRGRRLLRRRQRRALHPALRRGHPHRLLLRDRRPHARSRETLDGEQTREQALDAYAAFSRRHAPAYALALQLQKAIPNLPPKVLTQFLKLMGRERPCRTAFGWYLTLAHPSSQALAGRSRRSAWTPLALAERGSVD